MARPDVRSLAPIPRWALRAFAILFAAATLAYSLIWMYYIDTDSQVSIGLAWDRSGAIRTASFPVTAVSPGSAAEEAGLKTGDHILAVNGQALQTLSDPVLAARFRGRPGDLLRLKVQRAGLAAPLEVEIRLRPRTAVPQPTWAQRIVGTLLNSYPLVFFVVGFVVLFLRLESPHAWVMAVLFAGFISSAPLLMLEGVLPLAVRGFAIAYMILFYALAPAIFYCFFATFPAPSPLDRRAPWLKWALLAPSVAVALPLAGWVLWQGTSYPLWWAGNKLLADWFGLLAGILVLASFVLGLVSLLWNSISAPTEARRKTRVIVWGTVLGVAPMMLLGVASGYTRRPVFEFPFWIWAPAVLTTFLLPLSIAYAVVKHRVLEVPLLLKRSARYLLVQRGFVLLMLVMATAATLALSGYFSRRFPARGEIALPLGAIFGMVLVWAGTEVHSRVRLRLDRAFFRSAYDARRILGDLAQKARSASTRRELALLLEDHLREALHPKLLAIYWKPVKDGCAPNVETFPQNGRPSRPTTQPWWNWPAAGSRWNCRPMGPVIPPSARRMRNACCPLRVATHGFTAWPCWVRGSPRSRTRAKTSACWRPSPPRPA